LKSSFFLEAFEEAISLTLLHSLSLFDPLFSLLLIEIEDLDKSKN
jgi:hypothetical protein